MGKSGRITSGTVCGVSPCLVSKINEKYHFFALCEAHNSCTGTRNEGEGVLPTMLGRTHFFAFLENSTLQGL